MPPRPPSQPPHLSAPGLSPLMDSVLPEGGGPRPPAQPRQEAGGQSEAGERPAVRKQAAGLTGREGCLLEKRVGAEAGA